MALPKIKNTRLGVFFVCFLNMHELVNWVSKTTTISYIYELFIFDIYKLSVTVSIEMAKHSKLFKHRFTTMESPEMVVFSVVTPGHMRFINEVDGMGVDWEEPYNTYNEWYIDLDIPQKNPYDAIRVPRNIKGLQFMGFKWKEKIDPKSSLCGKIDFSKCTLWLNYAIYINHSKTLLVLNRKMADTCIAKYPGIKLQEFIANTVTQFTK